MEPTFRNTSDGESDRVPLTGLPPPHKRKLIEYSPILSSGVIIQSVAWLVAIGGMYGTYQADRTKSDLRVTQVEKDVAGNRAEVKESLTEIKTHMQKVQDSLGDVKESLAVIKARNDVREVRK